VLPKHANFGRLKTDALKVDAGVHSRDPALGEMTVQSIQETHGAQTQTA
jgi:hypothetical protein